MQYSKFLLMCVSLDKTKVPSEGYRVASEFDDYMDAAYAAHELNGIAERPSDADYRYQVFERR